MASGRHPHAEIDKTAARRIPLVHQLIHFADLRNFYREMREALISANRRARAQRIDRRQLGVLRDAAAPERARGSGGT